VELTTHFSSVSYILRANDEKGMTPKEIDVASQTFIIAGSETTATLLSGATFLLLSNPPALQKLTQEIRSSFRDEQAITFQNVAQLRYLNAVLEESLRLYPPVPTSIPRIIPEPGQIVCGAFVPANYSVGVHQWATYRTERNFRDANSFIPERWLNDEDDDARFVHDDKKALQPFSMGPRNCLGRK
jgi:cytochrome P450